MRGQTWEAGLDDDSSKDLERRQKAQRRQHGEPAQAPEAHSTHPQIRARRIGPGGGRTGCTLQWSLIRVLSLTTPDGNSAQGQLSLDSLNPATKRARFRPNIPTSATRRALGGGRQNANAPPLRGDHARR